MPPKIWLEAGICRLGENHQPQRFRNQAPDLNARIEDEMAPSPAACLLARQPPR